MEEMNLSQIERQIYLLVGEQLKQIKQKLLESLPKEINWQLEEKIMQVSKKIWQMTGMINNFQSWFDESGYLINSEDWSIAVAEYIAMEEGVPMTDAHWKVIHFMREYYEEYKFSPMVKTLVKAITKKLGHEKGNTKYLYELFPEEPLPGSPARQACKIAGLPKPRITI